MRDEARDEEKQNKVEKNNFKQNAGQPAPVFKECVESLLGSTHTNIG